MMRRSSRVLVPRVVLWTVVAWGVLGCRYGDKATFGGGGSTDDGGDTGEVSDDTGPQDTDTQSGTEAPILDSLEADFDVYPNIGDVIEIQAFYTDADGDVDGGTVSLEVQVSGGEVQPLTFSIDGTDAWDADGAVTFVIGPVDTAASYLVRVSITDVAGNSSNQLETEV